LKEFAMSRKALILALLVAGLASVSGYGLYSLGMNHGMQMADAAPSATPATAQSSAPKKAGDINPSTGKKVLFWHDPMVPGQKFDKPGKSPYMDMQLVPVYADGDADKGGVTISPRMEQNLGIRTAEVSRGTLAPALEAVGTVAYNERDVAVVQARSNGFLERLYVRAPLDSVLQGQALAEIYVPDWVAAQEEYLSAKRISARAADKTYDGLVEAARQRMRLAGMSEEQIRRIEASGTVQSRVALTAPISGVVAELAAREGMTVMAGAPLFRINGLSTIWVNAEVPEGLAMQVRPGNLVEARAPALPGVIFKGKVSAILPEVNSATRTLKARVELANTAGQLVPGMFATINFTPMVRKDVLRVPSEAIITTGTRNVVIVAQGDGRFAPVDVEVGAETHGQTEILKGLEAGQKVVVSGQFLVDSEASLKGTIARMGEAPSRGGDAGGTTHHGVGRVERIDPNEVTISHGPIPSLQWGAMTMGFKPPPTGMPGDIHVGNMVAFDIRATKDGAFEITAISRTATAAPAAGVVQGEIKGATK
jgi:Cu(I)/Ag(I) efflux system membrane fusion protein